MGSYTYSPTAASNTAVDGIGAQGSDSPDNIDNLVRALAASDANLVRDLGGANTVAGTADAITVALADATAVTAYFDGMRFSFRAGSDTTVTNPSLNVDSIGAKTIVKTVQGVETALIAGDIQAGQTCEVVYRSAFASAAGAFELLNPSIESSIELGHATDTTLSRSAAGQLAIEGGAGSLYAATIELGAASDTTLARSSAGVVTVESVQLQRVSYATVQSASGTAIDFSIPSWTKEIELIFDGLSLSGTDGFFIQLGDAGGVENTSYTGLIGYYSNAAASVVSVGSTSGVELIGNGAGRSIQGRATLQNITGNQWIIDVQYTHLSLTIMLNAVYRKTLSNTITTLRFTRTGTDTFDGGQLNCICRG
jgi:hypothetical protein